MARKQKYPNEIYVQWEQPGTLSDEKYLVANENPDTAAVVGEIVEIGIYKFVRVAKVSSIVKII